MLSSLLINTYFWEPGLGDCKSLFSWRTDKKVLFEPCHEKIGFLHMRKQSRRSALR